MGRKLDLTKYEIHLTIIDNSKERKTMTDTIVMRDSPEAAQPHTMQGWKTRNGYFYGDEATARYAGCTHIPCGTCGSPTRKGYTRCQDCRNLAKIARYGAMPRAEWDGKAMLYSQTHDAYYTDPGEAENSLEDGETLEDLRLVICKPNYIRLLDSEYCCDELPEDGDVPSEVLEAMKEFNEAVAGVVLSWSPGSAALSLRPQET